MAVACTAPDRCWGGPYTSLNLELNETQFPNLEARCKIRHDRLVDAMEACTAASWCGGIVKDTGFNLPRSACKIGTRMYELRSSVVDAPFVGGTAWFLHATGPQLAQPSTLCVRPCRLPEPKRQYAARVYAREAALGLTSPSVGAGATPRRRGVRACLSQLLLPPPQKTDVRAWLRRDDDVVACLVRSGKPFLVGRPSLGSERDAAYYVGVRERPIPDSTFRGLTSNAGIVTNGARSSATAFGWAYLDALNASDVSIRWNHRDLEPFFPRQNTFRVDELLHVTGHLPHLVLNHEVLASPHISPYLPRLSFRTLSSTTRYSHLPTSHRISHAYLSAPCPQPRGIFPFPPPLVARGMPPSPDRPLVARGRYSSRTSFTATCTRHGCGRWPARLFSSSRRSTSRSR